MANRKTQKKREREALKKGVRRIQNGSYNLDTNRGTAVGTPNAPGRTSGES